MDLAESVDLLTSSVTTLSTIALVYLTWVLSRETARLSDATAQPFVTVTIEPSPWTPLHFDLVLENSGNAAAFDVVVETDPKIGQKIPSEKGGIGMTEIDVLRPGQTISSFVAEAKEVTDLSYKVAISWKRTPNATSREEINYRYDVSKFKRYSRLGPATPFHQVASEIKKARDDWRPVATGQRRLKVDVMNNERSQESGHETRRSLGDVSHE
jgi:hypothetical protein